MTTHYAHDQILVGSLHRSQQSLMDSKHGLTMRLKELADDFHPQAKKRKRELRAKLKAVNRQLRKMQ